MTQLSKWSGNGMGFGIFASFYSKGIFSFPMSSSLPFSSPKVRKLLETRPFVGSAQLLEAMELPQGGKQKPFTISLVVWVVGK